VLLYRLNVAGHQPIGALTLRRHDHELSAVDIHDTEAITLLRDALKAHCHGRDIEHHQGAAAGHLISESGRV
jgi:hypothetical protein